MIQYWNKCKLKNYIIERDFLESSGKYKKIMNYQGLYVEKRGNKLTNDFLFKMSCDKCLREETCILYFTFKKTTK